MAANWFDAQFPETYAGKVVGGPRDGEMVVWNQPYIVCPCFRGPFDESQEQPVYSDAAYVFEWDRHSRRGQWRWVLSSEEQQNLVVASDAIKEAGNQSFGEFVAEQARNGSQDPAVRSVYDVAMSFLATLNKKKCTYEREAAI